MEDLNDSFSGILDATIVKVSDRHVLYSSNSFSGDSGGTLTLNGGNVLAVHLEGVNEAKERVSRKKERCLRRND